MMKTAAVIAELNPFHTGHAYLLRKLRENGAEQIIVIMSGNFVQRGDYAVFDKFDRAQAAVSCGAGLVVELPLPWAMSGAQTFAAGGVALARAFKTVDTLGFGCECGDADALFELVQAMKLPAFSQTVQSEMNSGITFAAARQKACEKLLGAQTASLLSFPNNALAVEYLTALQGTTILPFAVKRIGAGHDSAAENETLSGSLLREKIRTGGEVTDYVPPFLLSCEHTEPNRLDVAVLAALRTMKKEDFSSAPDLSEGLENRIFSVVQEAESLEDLFARSKTKRYTLARIRRIVWSLFLGITREDTLLPPPYLRVLAANESGKKLLSGAALPVSARAAQAALTDARAEHIFSLECAADDVFGLCFARPKPTKGYLRRKI